MKKLFPENRLNRKSLLEFLDKKGFYIILVLCIVIIGATAVFVTTNGFTPSSEGYDAEKMIPDDLEEDAVADLGANPAQQTIGEAAAVPAADVGKTAQDSSGQAAAQAGDKTASADKVAANTTKSSKPETATKKQDTAKVDPKSAAFIAPVFGEVSFEFAKDKLVYSTTLEEWRTHNGIDIAANRGTTVKCVADGTVTEVKNDPRFGITVIINHTNGLSTVYSNLASDEMVTPNQKVKKGDIIGCVGNTAVFESAEQSHLHFEVLKDNANIDPTPYLPK